jgi:hypothetical protein
MEQEQQERHDLQAESESQAKSQERQSQEREARLLAARARAQAIAAGLDEEQRWSSVKLSLPDVRQRLAQIGGPALLDGAWPDSAVVAGGSLPTAWFQQHTSPGPVDVDVFVSDLETMERLRALLEFLGYQVLQHHDRVGSLKMLEAKYVRQDQYRRLQVMLHRHANSPKRLVRTFDLYCSEAYWTPRDPEHVFVSSAGFRDWCDRTCRGGRFGLTVSQRRLDKYSYKGFSHVQETQLVESEVNELARRWAKQEFPQDVLPRDYHLFERLLHFWESPLPGAYLLWTPWIRTSAGFVLTLEPENPAHRKLSAQHLAGAHNLVVDTMLEADQTVRLLLARPARPEASWAVLLQQVKH